MHLTLPRARTCAYARGISGIRSRTLQYARTRESAPPVFLLNCNRARTRAKEYARTCAQSRIQSPRTKISCRKITAFARVHARTGTFHPRTPPRAGRERLRARARPYAHRLERLPLYSVALRSGCGRAGGGGLSHAKGKPHHHNMTALTRYPLQHDYSNVQHLAVQRHSCTSERRRYIRRGSRSRVDGQAEGK